MNSPEIAAGVAAFLIEGRELAQELESGLLSIEKGHDQSDSELINAMFRAAHTIKGSAGIVGIDSLQRFTHSIETLLDRVRSGEPLLNPETITQLLGCCDHIQKLLDLAEAGDTSATSMVDIEASLLRGFFVPTKKAIEVVKPKGGRAKTGRTSSEGFRLWAWFSPDCFRYGLDPGAALTYLAEQANIDVRVYLADCIPTFPNLNPEDCWMAIALHAKNASCEVGYAAFDFFKEDSVVVACDDDLPPEEVHDALQPLRTALGEMSIQPWVDADLIRSGEWMAAEAPLFEAERVVHTQEASNAEPVGVVKAVQPNPTARFVRVPAHRLDELISQVGELVIAGAAVDVQARQSKGGNLQEAVSVLMQLIDTIQSGTLQLRMVPIGETFSRFQRVVRDVSRDLGKAIQLEVIGAETELDKALVERIGDPLMHLVRNAMDHGLETPQERAAMGKPEQGTLRLRAFHDSGSVIVEVSDDGRGLSKDRILGKAIERRLIDSGEGLTDSEIYQLIFEPGFSTAEQVTSLSGRGVGMDVVKKSVEALRGSITLNSYPGEGTLIQMRLPLTLAIIEGFMVGVADARFILPIDMVVECIELPEHALHEETPRYINLRGQVLPYVELRQAFAVDGQTARRPSVVVVRCGDQTVGLLVDSLHGEIQTVIKPMSGIFQHLRAVCGTSILGTGDIALILDVNQLVQEFVEHTARATVESVINV